MAHVSGVGRYETEFVMDEEWSAENRAYLEMESAGGGTAAVYINGKKAPAVNIRTLKTDISGLLKKGKNKVIIEVTSTLTNRMLQRNYADRKSGWQQLKPEVQEYGLTGKVRIIPCL